MPADSTILPNLETDWTTKIASLIGLKIDIEGRTVSDIKRCPDGHLVQLTLSDGFTYTPILAEDGVTRFLICITCGWMGRTSG
jgi:hypothetical protein